MNSQTIKKVSILSIIGGFLGYIILHPVSVFIHYYFEENIFSIPMTLNDTFSISHLPMSLFFITLGIFFGLLYSLFMIRIIKLNNNLHNSNRQLLELDKLKSEFVAKVSHELKTPLTAMKGGIDLVLLGMTGKITAETKKYLSNSKRNIDRLQELVNKILDFEKYKSDKFKYNFINTNIKSIIKNVIESQIVVAEGKGLYLKLLHPLEPNKVMVDPYAMVQVFVNLISNSIKFTDNGGITIYTEQNKIDKKFIISVKDTGCGIAESDIPKLFNLFEQAGYNKMPGSSGLGLAICKNIINAHKGEIWIESDHGTGTIVHFILPMADNQDGKGEL